MPAATSLAIAAHPALLRARALLRAADDEVVALQARVSAIPAPTGGESRRAAFFAERLREAGLGDIRHDATGNVVGRVRPSAQPGVVIVAHLDTVFGPDVDVAVRREGTRLLGPGISDNARGLAALVGLARATVGAGWDTERPMIFAATVGEEGEGDLKGIKGLLAPPPGGVAACAVIALDGAGLARIVHRALGSRRFRVTFTGPGGHSWAAYGVANPAHAAGRFAAGLPELPRPAQPRSACSAVRVQGGTGLNSIPQTVLVDVDLRSEDATILADLEAGLRALATRAADEENRRRTAGTPALRVAVDVIGDRPPGMTPETDPLVAAAVLATRAVGEEPELATASTDANVPIARGIPGIALGAGGQAGDTHLPTEWYDNTGGPEGLARALLVLAAAAGLR
jgi:tripeptide aminopeptidase